MTSPSDDAAELQTKRGDAKPESNLSLQTPNSKSILQTAVTQVAGTKGPVNARLYFDKGGSRSFVSTALGRKIGAKLVGYESVSVGRFRDSRRSTITYKILEFQIQLASGEARTVRMSAEETISCPIQLIPLNTKDNNFLSCITLAEPAMEQPTMVSVDILVGNDYYYDFIGSEQIRCSNGIVLLSSPFGYVVGGSLMSEGSKRTLETSLYVDTRSTAPASKELERLWSLEEIGIKETLATNDDEAALQHFNQTVLLEDDRYYVKWPWKASHKHNLSDNYGLAFGRLGSLLRRISTNMSLMEAYDKVITEQRANEIIEEAPAVPQRTVHYLPHHCVVKPSKTTTKIRIVYDASAKTAKYSLSLNDCLHRGPIFLSDLVGITLRLRLPEVAMVSDIDKAFLQVGLQLDDRDVTRFLWLKDPSKPSSPSNIVAYRVCRELFGVISSPFLLAATIAHYLRTINNPARSAIHNNVYVDNIFHGTQTDQQAFDYYTEAKRAFAKASMNLREWHSNSKQFMDQIQQQDRGNATDIGTLWKIPFKSRNQAVGSIHWNNQTTNTRSRSFRV